MDKKVKTVRNGFIEIINKSKHQPNKLWSDQKLLDDNDILMYSAHNEGKSVVVERFIETLEGKIYKKMTATNKNLFSKYNNT